MLLVSGLVKSVAKSDLNDKMTLVKLIKKLMDVYDMFNFIKRKNPACGWCISSSGPSMGIC